MANRFWVGGSGTWNLVSTTHWSTTTGGSGGASVPTSSDSVFVDANSGSSPVIAIGAIVPCLDLNFTGAIMPTLQLNYPVNTGSYQINIFGSLTFITGLVFQTTAGTLSFQSTSTGKTVTTAGVTFPAAGIEFIGVGGGWTFQDVVTFANYINHTNGALDTNGKIMNTASGFFSNGTSTRTLTLGTSTINTSGTWSTTSTGMTYSGGSATINFGTGTFAGGGLSFNIVNLNGTISMSGSNTFVLLNAANATLTFTATSIQTASTNFNFKNCTLKSSSAGTPFILSKSSGTVILINCSVKDCAATGTSFVGVAGTINVSGNSGITFGGSIIVRQIADGRSYYLNSSGVLTVQ